MLFLRIKQAECALQAGRLDEAASLVQSPDVRAHHRGQRLVGQLVRNLLARARGHLAAERLDQALADGELAAVLGGNLPEVAQFRAAIADAAAQRHGADRRRAELLAAARDHIDLGRLSLGRRLLEELPAGGAGTEHVRRELELRRHSADSALAAARRAIERRDWPAAVEELLVARRCSGRDAELPELSARVAEALAADVRDDLCRGRLDRAAMHLEPLARLHPDQPQVRELQQAMDHARQARAAMEQARPRRARQALLRLASVLPEAQWLNEAVSAAQRAAEALDALAAGPLGLLAPSPSKAEGWGEGDPAGRHAPAGAGHPAPSPAPALPSSHKDVLPRRFMLQVDGVGGFLVLRDARVTLGPVSASCRPDLPLLAEATAPAVTIERLDEDYWLSAPAGVCVNDKPATRRLLGGGESIALSPRCRLRFLRPNAASTSALLSLTGGRPAGMDTRCAILLDREIVIGPGQAVHVRADRLAEPIVLQLRDGQLHCPAHPDAGPLTPGTPAELGTLRLVVTNV